MNNFIRVPNGTILCNLLKCIKPGTLQTLNEKYYSECNVIVYNTGTYVSVAILPEQSLCVTIPH